MLQLKNIKKTYKIGEIETQALKGVSVAFREKEFVAILGTSGSGKTTCLNIIGGLDNYTDGDLILNGKSTKDFTEKDWNSFRNNSIGCIFLYEKKKDEAVWATRKAICAKEEARGRSNTS